MLSCVIGIGMISSALFSSHKSLFDPPSKFSGTSNYSPDDNKLTTMSWSKDVVRLSTSEFVVDYLALNQTLVEKAQLVKVNCGFIKDHPFLMHAGVIIDWVCNNGGEHVVTIVMMYIFEKYKKDGKEGLMLDVGANAGFYSLLAAKYGHHAIQFDLQPECHIILRNSVLANGFHSQIVTVAAGVSESDSIMDVPDIGCDGRFPQAEPSKDAPIRKIHLHPLNKFIDVDTAEILLMKVDTEGNEKRVLSGAIDFFKKKKIQNAIVEVTPCCDFWKKAGINASDVYEIFGDIVSFGYVMVSLCDLKLLQTREEVVKYLSQEATFRQTDMWLTLDTSDVEKVIQSIQGFQQQQAS